MTFSAFTMDFGGDASYYAARGQYRKLGEYLLPASSAPERSTVGQDLLVEDDRQREWKRKVKPVGRKPAKGIARRGRDASREETRGKTGTDI